MRESITSCQHGGGTNTKEKKPMKNINEGSALTNE